MTHLTRKSAYNNIYVHCTGNTGVGGSFLSPAAVAASAQLPAKNTFAAIFGELAGAVV